jgi:hypothetical protein
MFASSSLMPRASAPISTVVARSGLAFALAVAGTVFLGLTVAATIAVPLAMRQGIALSPTELATAERLGSIWWLFAGGVVVSFGAALATLGKLLERLGESFES